MKLIILLAVASLGLLSVGRLASTGAEPDPWIIRGSTNLPKAKFPVSGGIQVETGDRFWLRPSEEVYLSRDAVLRDYIQRIQAHPQWDARIWLKVYRRSMIIVFVLDLGDSGAAEEVLNGLIHAVVEENPKRGGLRTYIGLRAILPVREGYY